MKIDKRFLDAHGNMKANSHQATSENPSTFNAITAILLDKVGLYDVRTFDLFQLNRNKYMLNNGSYFTMEGDYAKWQKELRAANFWTRLMIRLKFKRSSNRFSHDETNAVVCSSFYFGHATNLSHIEENTSQTWYRFYDVGCKTQYAKDPFNKDHLLGQIIHFAKNACMDTDKDRAGNYNASGKIQAWIGIYGLRLGCMGAIAECTDALPEKYKWIEVFRNYFPEHDHPINQLARMYYGR